MDRFGYQNDRYCAEGVDLQDLAETYGTPCFVYSRATIEHHYRVFRDAFPQDRVQICYAVKANSNLAVLDLLARLGAGFDIVSAGELERVLRAGGRPADIVFSGVGKSLLEIERALQEGIACFNVESEEELERIGAVAARLGERARISLRVNPDIDPRTHAYIATGLGASKFGIDFTAATRVYERASEMKHIEVLGIDCHIGSQLVRLEPYLEALDRLLELADDLARRGIAVQQLDLGGGFGIRYRDEEPPAPKAFAEALLKRLDGRPYRVLIEPGRAIVGNAGVLLTRVEYLKQNAGRRFAVVDAGMNDFLRPALYGAWQEILAVNAALRHEEYVYDIVGPVCESGDFLGKERRLAIAQGDLLVLRSAGAYGFVMSSNYNSRPRAAEVMVDGDRHYAIRKREGFADLYSGENLLDGG